MLLEMGVYSFELRTRDTGADGFDTGRGSFGHGVVRHFHRRRSSIVIFVSP